jgi:molybdopterin synthase catalytic subunit
MRVHVLFFGQLKEIVGRAEDDTEVDEGARVEDLFASYGRKHPALTGFRASVVASVNQVFAEWQSRLSPGDEVAFLPPVSGGADAGGIAVADELCEIVYAPINTTQIVARMKAPEDGAVVVFEGIVRNHSAGRRTLYLEYEGYEPMALAKMREIALTMRTQFAINRVALVHRLGRLEIGETSVLIAVTSAHRAVAFDACRLGIDTLKRIVPIWKKEYFEDGAVWADGELPPVPSKSAAPESKT